MKGIEASLNDIVCTRLGDEPRVCMGDSTSPVVDISSNKQCYLGVQVKTSNTHRELLEDGTVAGRYRFQKITGYSPDIALVCVLMNSGDDAGRVLFFPSSDDVKTDCSGNSLSVTLASKYGKIQEKTERLFEKCGATYAVLCEKLVELVEEHRKLGKLKSWVDANQPAPTAVTHQMELSAHIELVKKCKEKVMQKQKQNPCHPET